jgi:hypothetical protein
VEVAACVQAQPGGPTYVRRQPEKTVLFRVMQKYLRLIALIKSQDIAKKILVAMHLPAGVIELHPVVSNKSSPAVMRPPERRSSASQQVVSGRQPFHAFLFGLSCPAPSQSIGRQALGGTAPDGSAP